MQNKQTIDINNSSKKLLFVAWTKILFNNGLITESVKSKMLNTLNKK